ncbi:serine threonine-protein kinase nek5 [Chrysochromulina tobinii]|uniref:non-specific serine/threonine protein kinase n=1 Tax=Chrysochromulina tobinii TaxID=1460289 RepID=A0A0M0K8B3_9EUKA|nr:serine threonine-protein kinase nek5 [Chrysochromulina tobinii]|eukprot:KOO35029.1 serine threonine-protein kinase nek5 [Chrysochromulina sp. CCMP291]
MLASSNAPPDPLPTCAEDFEASFTTAKELGRGRFGEVRLVEHRVTGQRYALKRTAFGSAGQPDRDKVQLEARALDRLMHVHVVRHYAAWPEANHFCILMEYGPHGNFAQLLAKRWDKATADSKKFLDEDEVMSHFVQLADGLGHIHAKKVLHRDLKPENIFVYDGGVLKIGDLGIARCLTTSIELAQTVVGSPTYISPEIIHGAQYDYKTDVWSLGVLLYKMASNRYPFDASNLAQLALKITAGFFAPLSPKYSPLLHHLVASMLQIDLDARTDTAGVWPMPLPLPLPLPGGGGRRKVATGSPGRQAAAAEEKAAVAAADAEALALEAAAAAAIEAAEEAAREAIEAAEDAAAVEAAPKAAASPSPPCEDISRWPEEVLDAPPPRARRSLAFPGSGGRVPLTRCEERGMDAEVVTEVPPPTRIPEALVPKGLFEKAIAGLTTSLGGRPY